MVYDAVIVGSGPGGATLAKELSECGRSVLLLERAPASASDNRTPRGRDAIADHVVTSGGVAVRRGLGVGGSSLLYFGTAWDPPLEMFRRLGVELAAAVEEAKQELPIAPIEESLLGVRARRLRDSANSLGYAWARIPKLVDQRRLREGESVFASRWNAGSYVRAAVAKGAELRTGARVVRVLVGDATAAGVEFVENGVTEVAIGRRVVLCCGGFGTPAVLQASGVSAAGQGFFCDPLIAVSGSCDDLRSGEELPMVVGEHHEHDGYMITDMTLPPEDHERLAALSRPAGGIPSYASTLTIMVKARDAIAGTLRGEKAERSFDAADLAKLDRGFDMAREILLRAGARDVYRSPVMAAHPGGTVRLGEAVDSNLETEVRNLFVCDASVIPEPWGVPPSLTIISLAKRLADYLAER